MSVINKIVDYIEYMSNTVSIAYSVLLIILISVEVSIFPNNKAIIIAIIVVNFIMYMLINTAPLFRKQIRKKKYKEKV